VTFMICSLKIFYEVAMSCHVMLTLGIRLKGQVNLIGRTKDKIQIREITEFCVGRRPFYALKRAISVTSSTLSCLHKKLTVVTSKGTSTTTPLWQSSMRRFVWNLLRTSASSVSIIAGRGRGRVREEQKRE
jgi:hypothetical protein